MNTQTHNEKEVFEFAGWRCRVGRRRDGLPTLKQAQTIAGLAAGMTQKEIARLRGVSPATVNSTVMNVNFWLNTTKSAAAVAEAMRRGWISPLCMMLVMFSLMSPGGTHHAVRVNSGRPSSSISSARRELSA